MELDQDSGTIPLHRHPLGFIEAFCQLGADQVDLLEGTGLSVAMFDMQEMYISYRQLQRLLRNGLHLCARPGLGILVGMKFGWSFWGPVGYVVDCSPSLKHAGEAFRRYLVTSQPYFAAHAARPNAYMDADCRIVEPIDYTTGSDDEPALRDFVREWRLAITLRLWDQCGNKSVEDPSVHVCLDYPRPADTSAYELLPCDSLRFDSGEFTISAHMDYVFRHFRPLRKRAYERIIRECEQELTRIPQQVALTDRVRWHIRGHFHPDLDLNTVASQLRMTPRSLSRQLAMEASSFRRILHEVRMEIAGHQLRHSQLDVDDIAALAGFSCGSSLRRAVKQWAGVTVSELREMYES